MKSILDSIWNQSHNINSYRSSSPTKLAFINDKIGINWDKMFKQYHIYKCINPKDKTLKKSPQFVEKIISKIDQYLIDPNAMNERHNGQNRSAEQCFYIGIVSFSSSLPSFFVQPTMHFLLKAYGRASLLQPVEIVIFVYTRNACLPGCSLRLPRPEATRLKTAVSFPLDFPRWIRRSFSFRSIH